MRILKAAAAAAVFVCLAGSAFAQQQSDPWPFPVARGSAIRPPAAGGTQSAPPEGAGAAGLDFGQWRNANPDTYAPAFQTQITRRFSGKNASEIRTDLEANGFACEDATRLDCRIEITEQQCAVDWYVVVERGQVLPIAGFERACQGAR